MPRSVRRTRRSKSTGSRSSIYFRDPDGLGLEIYYEVPDALNVFAAGRSDEDRLLPLSKPGDPLPDWLYEEWPRIKTQAAG
jgi:hypothetical protein